jgi:CubicO group peptidase (beta-lactamase class C family)
MKHPAHLWAFGFFLLTFPLGAQTPVATVTPTSTPYSLEHLKMDLSIYLDGEMTKRHVKGLSLALVDGDQVLWVKGFGFAKDQGRVFATGDTLYHLGAVSKIFTAAEVLRLAQMGKVRLDASLTQYLPEFSIRSRFKKTKPITLKALLANHSGLPGFFLKGIWVDHPEGLEDLEDHLKDDYLVAPPQTLYKYSYVDYDLLGRAVEAVRDENFADAVKEDLFEPLGMDSSSFDDSSDHDPRLAQGYRHGDPVTLIHLRDTPAAGMVSSANDMARFLQYLLGGPPASGKRPLNKRSVASMFTPAYPKVPMDFGHEVGMGWQLSGIQIDGAEGVAWHDGQFPPYCAQVAVLPKEKLGLVLLSNSVEAVEMEPGLARRAFQLMLQMKKGLAPDLSEKKPKMPPTVEVPPETLQDDSGFYSALGQIMKVRPKEKCLGAEWDGHDLELLPVGPNTFVPHLVIVIFPIDLPQFPLTFSKVGGKGMAVLGGLTFPVPLQRIEQVPISPLWREREGDYELENGDGVFQFSRIRLEEREGFLTVDLKVSFPAFDLKDQGFKVALLPLSDQELLVPGLFYGDGGTLRFEEDASGVTRALYSGYRFKKLWEGRESHPTPNPVVGR